MEPSSPIPPMLERELLLLSGALLVVEGLAGDAQKTAHLHGHHGDAHALLALEAYGLAALSLQAFIQTRCGCGGDGEKNP